MSKPNVEFIDPRDANPRLVDLKRPVFDEQAIARANEALKSMSESFQQWLDEEIARLQAARVSADTAGWSTPRIEAVFAVAHDLKGMGATYGYPLVTQLAASLCRLIETDAGKALAGMDPKLARAHVDAIRAAVRDQITSNTHPVGAALVRALDSQVEALGVAPR